MAEPRPEALRVGRRHTLAAVGSVILLVCWGWVTGGNPNEFWMVVAALIVGLGAGFGWSGARRATGLLRLVAALCFVVQLLAAIGLGASGILDR